MSVETSDLIIIGAGPGGYVAAIRAAQLGLKTTLVEKTHLGGVCLNWGCIPTKALLKCAEMYHHMKHAQDFGITATGLSFDLAQMVRRSREISEKLSSGVRHLMKKNGVRVIQGHGRLKKKKEGFHQVSIELEEKKDTLLLTAKAVIIATGARPRVLKGLEPEGNVIWTAREAMIPSSLPQHLLVVGSGAIGLEFASFYQMLGSHVHLIEMQSQLFPIGDPEISALLHQAFHKRGISIHTETTVESWKKEQKNVQVHLKTPKETHEITVDRILVATGVTGNVEELGLENTQIQIDRGHIVTQEICATHEPGVYAIGDVTAGPWLAHKASHEAIACVEHIAGKNPHPLDPLKVPGCVYSTPQIASIGLTEPQARERGYTISVGQFPFLANGKALTQGESEGLIKIIFEQKTGEILGAHLIGPEVTELISGVAIAQSSEATEQDLLHTIFPHPTLSESIHEAILNGLGRGLHF